MSGLLAGVRVVDLTDLRGALCARILADLGAEVIRVEPPGAIRHPGDRLADLYRNANKTIATGDVDLAELCAEADILVENLLPADRGELMTDLPHLVHVALSDLGLSGPRADWRLEPLPALAASGALHGAGIRELPPCNAPGYLAHDCASVYGALGAVAALMDRERRRARPARPSRSACRRPRWRAPSRGRWRCRTT